MGLGLRRGFAFLPLLAGLAFNLIDGLAWRCGRFLPAALRIFRGVDGFAAPGMAGSGIALRWVAIAAGVRGAEADDVTVVGISTSFEP